MWKFILNNILVVKIVIVLILFTFITLKLSKTTRNYKSQDKIVFNYLILLIITSFAFITTSIDAFVQWYSNISKGLTATSTTWLFIYGILLFLIITVIKMRFAILELNKKIVQLDQKYGLDKNAKEYKKRNDVLYRSGS